MKYDFSGQIMYKAFVPSKSDDKKISTVKNLYWFQKFRGKTILFESKLAETAKQKAQLADEKNMKKLANIYVGLSKQMRPHYNLYLWVCATDYVIQLDSTVLWLH